MPSFISAAAVADLLAGKEEIALFDIREQRDYQRGHPFFAVSLPYSRLEIDVRKLAPRTGVKMVLIGSGDELAARAGRRLLGIGYRDVSVVDGGIAAWQAAGQSLVTGTHSLSETLARLVASTYRTPCLTAAKLHRIIRSGRKLVVLDSRTGIEHQQSCIPGAIASGTRLTSCCKYLPEDEHTIIVVHAGAFSRSVIGAQTLINLGVRNPVYALQDGIEGWVLQGLPLQHGSAARIASPVRQKDKTDGNKAAERWAGSLGVPHLDARTAQAWIDDTRRTTYVFDVRPPDDTRDGPIPDAIRLTAEQLVHATDHHVGTRNARIIVTDADGTQAVVTAAWLHQLGFEAGVLDRQASRDVAVHPCDSFLPVGCAIDVLDAERLRSYARGGPFPLIELRPSTDFRRGHAAGAIWSIRPKIVDTARRLIKNGVAITLLADDHRIAQLAALDLKDAGFKNVQAIADGLHTWRAAGLAVHGFKGYPSDIDSIDCPDVGSPFDAGAGPGYRAPNDRGWISAHTESELGAFRVASEGALPSVMWDETATA